MHIVRIMEGFGNQIYQYMFYLKLKETYPDDRVYADISFYDTKKPHGGYKLGGLADIDYIKPTKAMKRITVHDDTLSVIKFKSGETYYYDGYWQDPKIFPRDMTPVYKIFDEARLSEKNREYAEMIKNSNAVSVHVRRGDYLNNWMMCNISNGTYYQNAINYCNENIEDPTFFVFSNDMERVKEELDFGGSRAVFVEGNDPQGSDVYADILLMSLCGTNIIANSSFSNLAVLLNKREDKTVLSPPYCLNDGDGSPEGIHIPNVRKLSGNFDPDEPFFSIIAIPQRKSSQRACLVSLLNQSFENIEILIPERCFSEYYFGVVPLEYAKNDPRVRTLPTGDDLSASEVKAELAKKAKGKYIIFADMYGYFTDDACMELYGGLCGDGTELIGFGYKKNTYSLYKMPEKRDASAVLIPNRIFSATTFCASAELVKRVTADAPRCNVFEDRYFVFALMLAAKSYRYFDAELYQGEEYGISRALISLTEVLKKHRGARSDLKCKQKGMEAVAEKYAPECKKAVKPALKYEKKLIIERNMVYIKRFVLKLFGKM